MNYESPTLIEVYDAIADGYVVEKFKESTNCWVVDNTYNTCFELNKNAKYRIRKELVPHVHNKVIKAFARGAKIQYFDTSIESWEDIDNPTFYYLTKYRVKPIYVTVRRYWYVDTTAVHEPIRLGIIDKEIYINCNRLAWVPIGRFFLDWEDGDWVKLEVPAYISK